VALAVGHRPDIRDNVKDLRNLGDDAQTVDRGPASGNASKER
jgi:hypothetical protein